jgi:hypothetical protein
MANKKQSIEGQKDNIMTKRKRTIYYLQNTLQATKDRATRTPPKNPKKPGVNVVIYDTDIP